MKNHALTILLSGLFILLTACSPRQTSTPEDYGLSSDTLAVAAQEMQAFIDNGTYAGIATLVLADGKAIDRHNYGYADIAAQKPVDDGTIYRIYSMTKPIVAAGLMILYDEGKFRLDDPVADYIPPGGPCSPDHSDDHQQPAYPYLRSDLRLGPEFLRRLPVPGGA